MLLDRLGLEHPVVQAGMGGGIAGGALAGAVSAAGGLGTVGILPPRALREELERAGELAGGRPVAANLLIPFTTRGHVDACLEARVAAVVLHAGFSPTLVERLRAGGVLVLHTVGTPEEASRALVDGADGLVAQGLEAGGHLVGVEPALEALPRMLEIAGDAPALLAGGIADAADSRRALDAGAAAIVAGTRFLLTEESGAHPAYKRRVLVAERTLETQLFGLSWPMRHRVIPNAATERWCRGGERGPCSGAWRRRRPFTVSTPRSRPASGARSPRNSPRTEWTSSSRSSFRRRPGPSRARANQCICTRRTMGTSGSSP